MQRLRKSSFVMFFYLKNAQGDIAGMRSQIDGSLVYYNYDEWGKLATVRYSEGASEATIEAGSLNPLRFRGYYYDKETGFYYLNSRYYDPNTGRYINADAFISTGQGLIGNNMFAYCANNSVLFSDPDGRRYMIEEGGSKKKSSGDAYRNWIQSGNGATTAPLKPYISGNKPQEYKYNDYIAEIEAASSNQNTTYKNKNVVRHSWYGMSSFSIVGTIFLNNNVLDNPSIENMDENYYKRLEEAIRTVQHEYGHLVQEELLGEKIYISAIAIPSVNGYMQGLYGQEYYSQPWEMWADFFGGVDRGENYYLPGSGTTLENYMQGIAMYKNVFS